MATETNNPELVKIKGELDAHIDLSVKKAIEDMDLSDVKTSLKSLSEKMRSQEETNQKVQESIGSIDASIQKQIEAKKDFREALRGDLEKHREKLNRDNHSPIILKAVGDFGMGNITNGGLAYRFTETDMRPGVAVSPLYDNHIRPFLRQTQTTKDTITYNVETGREGDFGMVNMGADKPQWDLDLAPEQTPVRKIAGYFRIPEEMVDDIPWLLNYIINRGLEEYRNREDAQLLYGSGVGINLKGMFTAASSFSAGTTRTTSPNNLDVLLAAKGQLRRLNLVGRVAMVNPDDYTSMLLAKGSDGHYVFSRLPGTEIITVGGTPIVDNNRITAGEFLMADTQWCEIADRKGIEVRLFDQDRDNVIKNLITCVIEGRLAFPIYRPQAFVKGTFTAAKAALIAA